MNVAFASSTWRLRPVAASTTTRGPDAGARRTSEPFTHTTRDSPDSSVAVTSPSSCPARHRHPPLARVLARLGARGVLRGPAPLLVDERLRHAVTALQRHAALVALVELDRHAPDARRAVLAYGARTAAYALAGLAARRLAHAARRRRPAVDRPRAGPAQGSFARGTCRTPRTPRSPARARGGRSARPSARAGGAWRSVFQHPCDLHANRHVRAAT